VFEIARALPDVRFRMIGGPGGEQGADHAYFREIREQARLLPNLEFIGFVPFTEIEPHFDSARLFLSTSAQEGFPNTFLQAWARGIPTISFLDSQLAPNLTPICTMVRDTAEAATAIKTLWSHPDEWESIGERCRRYYYARHTPATVIMSLERVLKSL